MVTGSEDLKNPSVQHCHCLVAIQGEDNKLADKVASQEVQGLWPRSDEETF